MSAETIDDANVGQLTFPEHRQSIVVMTTKRDSTPLELLREIGWFLEDGWVDECDSIWVCFS